MSDTPNPFAPQQGHLATAITSFPQKQSEMSSEMMELEKQTFAIAFESALEHLSDGTTFQQFCDSYHIRLHPARFRRWIFRDSERKHAYNTAKALGMEAIEDSLIRIADGIAPDGTPSPNEVARCSLMIETRKWVMSKVNPRKYGDNKRVEQTTLTRFDPNKMTNEELARQVFDALGINVIDGEAEEVE